MIYKNSFTFKGYTSQKPELVHTKSNHFTVVSIATNYSKKNADGTYHNTTHWHKVKIWGNLAIKAIESIEKGSLVEVSGFIVPDFYQTKEGAKKETIDFVVNTLDVFPNNPIPKEAKTPSPKQEDNGDMGFVDPFVADQIEDFVVAEDDLPF